MGTAYIEQAEASLACGEGIAGDEFFAWLDHGLNTLRSGMRIWVVAPYIIFYRFCSDDDTIRVMRVLDGRRNVTQRLFRL